MKSIVVSVCAKTADELIKNIKKAEAFADIIELRFDCLDESELTLSDANESDIDKLNEQILKVFKAQTDKEFLMTLRSAEQGGQRKLTYKERELFWNLGLDFHGGDFEEDIIETSYYWLYQPRIISYHDFDRVPHDLGSIYERLTDSSADIVKIAVQTNDITDGLPLWKLLKKPRKEDQRFVPIAMGEAGKWTRILGLAYGAPLTYAALETGKEVAPGQISAEELRDVYRVKELTEETDIYGVIGDPIGHSLSPHMQNAAFKAAGLDAVLVPFEVKDLDSFITRFLPESGLNIKGFAVTIPHKQAIMKHLHEIDETAQRIGAVNTVKIIDGKLHGYNTDVLGFITPLKKAYSNLQGARAAILGAGGAARACIYAMQKEGVEVTIFARDLEKADFLSKEFDIEIKELPITNHQLLPIVINTTPLGTKGELENQTIATAEQLKGVKLAYDLVYNPNVTQFMREAEIAGVPVVLSGVDMLVAQGAEQFKIWTGHDAPFDEMKRALLSKL